MIPPSVPPLPSGYHSAAPAVPPLPPASPPLPPSTPFGTQAFRLKILLAFVLIFGFLVWQNVFVKDSKDRQEKSDRAELYVDALTDTKMAYSNRYDSIGEAEVSTRRRKRMDKDAQDAVKGWQKLADSPRASAADWRRLGIVQSAFNPSRDASAGMQAFEKAAELSTHARTKKQRDDFETEPYPETAKDSHEEREHWELIYGKRPLNRMDAEKLRAVIGRYQLGWFEHLVAAQIYAKTGDSLNASAERESALASCRNINRVNNLRTLLVLWGFGSWIVYLIQLIARHSRPKVAQYPSMDIPSKTAPTNAFSFRARIIAFLLNLIIPVSAIIPFAFLRGLLASASPLVLERVQVVAYLLFAFGAAGTSLWVMGRISDSENARPSGSRKPILTLLGFPGREPLGDMARGVHYYGMALVVTLIAGLVSHWLFHNFKTPSHPIVRELLIMRSPIDRLLILLEAAVTAAITEEIMFRGVLYPAFRQRFGAVRGILLTSALFALAHPTLPGGFLPLMALGASFNVAYEKRGSLVPGITMHALNNGLLVLSQFALMAS